MDTETLCQEANRTRSVGDIRAALFLCWKNREGEPQILHLHLRPGVGSGYCEFFLKPINEQECVVIEIWRSRIGGNEPSGFLRTNHGVMTHQHACCLVLGSTRST
jgi:hypothetical protein